MEEARLEPGRRIIPPRLPTQSLSHSRTQVGAPPPSEASARLPSLPVTAAFPSRDATAAALPHISVLAPFQHAPVAVSVMDIDSVVDDRSRRATSVLSMDDIEAAQTLEGLRSEYGQSPRASSQRSVMPMSTTSSPDVKPEPEPLLSLLTSTHPLISSAINGSMSAYTSSKSYSPRFKSGAEFLERNIAPVANKVGTVGRKTGVESGLRWALERRGSASADSSRAKRRKVGGENNQSSDSVDVNVDVQKRQEGHASLHRARSSSDISCSESLPPYDDLRSPSYDEVSATAIPSSSKGRARSTTWQSRLMISTSGLGVAMSEESLRSLQYCLTWLRWANERLGKAILALKHTLKEWEDVKLREDQDNPDSALSRRIDAVKEDVLATLKRVVGIVSKYAGGALPENARNLVRRHLTSLPRRFQIASSAKLTPADSSVQAFDATIAGANRALVLAQEGLDIMAQVTCVVNDTLVSAEHWCDRLGKKRSDYRTRTDTPKQQQEPQSESVASDIKEPVVSSEPRNADTKELIVSLGRDTQMSGTEKA